MSRLGMADMGIATLNDMRANAEMIANLDPSVPLIADADTGYGGPIMVARTVSQYIRAGVAGLHLEDQVVNKRCGHLNGKQLVDVAEYASRIKAAAMAREKNGDIVIIARTDALQGHGYAEAIKRLRNAVSVQQRARRRVARLWRPGVQGDWVQACHLPMPCARARLPDCAQSNPAVDDYGECGSACGGWREDWTSRALPGLRVR
jgi:hypothetical protein